MTINWKEITKEVQQELGSFDFKPTLRTMFYRLFSKQLIPNTRTTYNSLSRAMVLARMDGRLMMDCFADNSRQVIGSFNEIYWTPQELINARTDYLKDTVEDYTEYIPRWHNQPSYVEIWIEKDAMVGTFLSILEGYEVRLVPMKGFASLTFLYDSIRRLKRFQSGGKSVHVLYYGDFDPSGDYIDTDLQNRMREMGFNIRVNHGSFERVAVTPKQIKRYDLPYDPDDVTSIKMGDDTRTKGFLKKYGRLYAVELDALPALIPHIFRQELVIDKVERYFDNDIYQKLFVKYSSSDIDNLVRDSVKGLIFALDENAD